MRGTIMRAILVVGIAVTACNEGTEEAKIPRNAAQPDPAVAVQPADSSPTDSSHAGMPGMDTGSTAAPSDRSSMPGMQGGRGMTAGMKHNAAQMAAMPGMKHDSAQMAAMPGMKHDSSQMAAMPGMKHDSAQMAAMPGMKHDSSQMAAMPGMKHDSAQMSGMPGMAMPGMDMPGMQMWMKPLGAGWHVMGMAQAFPIVTAALGAPSGSSLDAAGLYLTQPALMVNLESPGSRVTLRTTLNFEGITQPWGELTFGGWGEGFLDKRHPHTLLHEAMLSVNAWEAPGGALSISAGKGFAPFGTDDPMSRPVVKYPTNHHLSQILERWTVNGTYRAGPWSVEAGLFGGGEPVGPYDFSNIRSFGDSWSGRVARRFGSGSGTMAEWEVSASHARVREVHNGAEEFTRLYNVSVRHEKMYSFGTLYGLVEASKSEPGNEDGYFSVLGETRLNANRHQPYYRMEYATRPEYERAGAPGTSGFFRYDHDAEAIGATRWLINTAGYGYELTGYPLSARPFVEVQYSRVSAARGGIEPIDLFGKRKFWGLTAGMRLFMGGDPMRMGSYGVLDAMTDMHRGTMAGPSGGAHSGHE